MPSTLRATERKPTRTKQANQFQRSVTQKQRRFTKPRTRTARYLHRPTSILATLKRKTRQTHLLHLMRNPQSQSRLLLPSERSLPRMQKRRHRRQNKPRQRHPSQWLQSRYHTLLGRRHLRRRRRLRRKRRTKGPETWLTRRRKLLPSHRAHPQN